jgi:hypothetical protein
LALVIAEFGSDAQKEELKKLRHDSVEARWLLVEQLTEDAWFGTDKPAVSNRQVSNLQCGRRQKNKKKAAEGDDEGEGDEEEGGEEQEPDWEEEDFDRDDEDDPSSPPRRSTRKRACSPKPGDATPRTQPRTQAPRDVCQLGVATTQGTCGIKGCKNQNCMSGCRMCGYRFCMVKCMNKHLRGEGELKRLRDEIEWKSGEWYD